MAPPWLKPSSTTFEVSMHSSLSTFMSTAFVYSRSRAPDQSPLTAPRVTKIVESLAEGPQAKIVLAVFGEVAIGPVQTDVKRIGLGVGVVGGPAHQELTVHAAHRDAVGGRGLTDGGALERGGRLAASCRSSCLRGCCCLRRQQRRHPRRPHRPNHWSRRIGPPNRPIRPRQSRRRPSRHYPRTRECHQPRRCVPPVLVVPPVPIVPLEPALSLGPPELPALTVPPEPVVPPVVDAPPFPVSRRPRCRRPQHPRCRCSPARPPGPDPSEPDNTCRGRSSCFAT